MVETDYSNEINNLGTPKLNLSKTEAQSYQKVIRGSRDGKAVFLTIKGYHKKTLDQVYKKVYNRDWDYVCCVAGIPGAGKSEFAKLSARYLSPWFDETYIAWNAQDFIRITTNAPEYSSVVLDESFKDLNSSVSRSGDFMKIINHLQLIRKRHLFIFLCLPNFFDLAPGIAVFRTSHLFVVYADDEGNRGHFAAYDRERKRMLYTKGKKFLDYNANPPNYKERFYKSHFIPDEIYDSLKDKNLRKQEVGKERADKWYIRFVKLITLLNKDKILNQVQIGKIIGVSGERINQILKTSSEKG